MGQPLTPTHAAQRAIEPDRITSPVPPTPTQLRAAAVRLRRPLTLRLALHLALPVTEVPSIAVRRFDGGLVYRAERCFAASDIATTACRLAGLGHTRNDRYLVLNAAADPKDWVKPIRTGTAWVVFGTDVLFDGPHLQLSPDTDPAVVKEVLEKLAEGMDDLPLVLPSASGHLFIDGTPTSLHVSTGV